MSVRKSIHQLIHEAGKKKKKKQTTGRAPSPGSFIDCSSDWAEQSSLAQLWKDLGMGESLRRVFKLAGQLPSGDEQAFLGE